MKAKALSLPSKYILNSKSLFFIFATLLVAMFGLYVYLVNLTIMNVVARERVESTISELSTTIGTLEFKYMTIKNGITLDLAHAKGFNDASPTSFLAKTEAVPALSYNSTR